MTVTPYGSQSSTGQFARVQIIDVSFDERVTTARDRSGNTYRIALTGHGPTSPIPKSGEVWLIERDGTQWHLYANEMQPSLVGTAQGDHVVPGNRVWLGDFCIELAGTVIRTRDKSGKLRHFQEVRSGTSRPTGIPVGYSFWDTRINKLIVWNGSAWRDAMGGSV